MFSDWPPSVGEVAAAMVVAHYCKNVVVWGINHKPQVEQWVYDQYCQHLRWRFDPQDTHVTRVAIAATVVGWTTTGDEEKPILRLDP